MKNRLSARTLFMFFVSVLVATVIGSMVQTHYNLQPLASLGIDLQGVRAGTMARDVFSGFTPTYGGYIVLPALLVAFAVAAMISTRKPAWRTGLFVVGGYFAVLAAIPLVNFLSPVALLVGASRDVSANFWMATGGAIAGLLFALLTPTHARRDAIGEPRRVDASRPVTSG